MKNLRQTAFTLIELMVVVTILILLFALLAPTLTLALDHAKQSNCQKGLRNIGVAFGSYSSANNQCIPKCGTPNIGNANPRDDGIGWTWQYTLVMGGYIPLKSPITDWAPKTDAFTCPSDPRLTNPPPSNKGAMSSYFMPVVVPDYERFGCSTDAYSYDLGQSGSHTISVGVMDLCYYWSYNTGQVDAMGNGVWNPRTTKPAPMPHMNMSRIADPAGTMMLIEGLGYIYTYRHFDEGWVGDPCAWAISQGNELWPSSKYVRRHNGRQEVLACDGSVKLTLSEDTSGPEYSTIFHSNNLSWDNIDEWWSKFYAEAWSANGTLRKAAGHGMWSIAPGD